jgi:hypothetical protein
MDDLIYMNSSREEIGVLLDYYLDMELGGDHDFELKVNEHILKTGYYFFYEGRELGGVIDSIKVDSSVGTIKYLGRTWRGILNSKIVEPDTGDDYLLLTGELNDLIDILITRQSLDGLFTVSTDNTGVSVTNHQVDRHITLYEAIMGLLESEGYRLSICYGDDSVLLEAVAIIDYSDNEEVDSGLVDLVVQRNDQFVNHLICLGSGELADRTKLHLYADEDRDISSTQSIFGAQEWSDTYDYSNAESTADLTKKGTEYFEELISEGDVSFSINEDYDYEIGDIIDGKEVTTGISVQKEITKKIHIVENGFEKIKYEVGE